MLVNKTDLKDRIDPSVFNSLEGENFNIETIDSKLLLTWNRLDVAFKLFFLQNFKNCPQIVDKVYSDFIRVKLVGDEDENGRTKQHDIEIDKNEFDFLLEYATYSEKPIIPISKNGTIISGSYHTASAILLKKEISTIQISTRELVFNYEYFLNRGVSEEILELVVDTFIEHGQNIYFAFLWPSGKENHDQYVKLFNQVIYIKDLELTFKGANNLLHELYRHQDLGISKKLINCFPKIEPVKVIVFQSSDNRKVRELKEKIRSINKIGFSAIHTTDSMSEAIRISKLIFNANGLHFLNYSNLKQNRKFFNKVDFVKNVFEEKKINIEEFVFGSNFVLEAYGFNEDYGIDCICTESKVFELEKMGLNVIQQIDFAVDKQELIYNPLLYFVYKGMKFIAFNNAYYLKVNSAGKFQKERIKESKVYFIYKKYFREIDDFVNSTIYTYKTFKKYRLTMPTLNLLKKLKLYNLARIFYLRFK